MLLLAACGGEGKRIFWDTPDFFICLEHAYTGIDVDAHPL
jgi:hypothetical protein